MVFMVQPWQRIELRGIETDKRLTELELKPERRAREVEVIIKYRQSRLEQSLKRNRQQP